MEAQSFLRNDKKPAEARLESIESSIQLVGGVQPRLKPVAKACRLKAGNGENDLAGAAEYRRLTRTCDGPEIHWVWTPPPLGYRAAGGLF